MEGSVCVYNSLCEVCKVSVTLPSLGNNNIPSGDKSQRDQVLIWKGLCELTPICHKD